MPTDSMFLRAEFLAVNTALATTLDIAPPPSYPFLVPGYSPENWSSLIGIITAIVGNVLISFALNLQRYAHIRLEREWREKERLRKRRSASYGTLSADTGGDGAGKYHWPRSTTCPNQDGHEEEEREEAATETQPLLGAPDTTRSRLGTSRKSSGGGSSAEVNAEEAIHKQKSYLKSPWWWAGIILMTTGEAGNFLAYGFAPASIVSPLGVVALISNCIIAPIMLKEKFRTRDGLGVLVAVAGAVTVVASASDNNPKLGPDDIWGLITTWEFETYLGVTIAVIIGLIIASNKFGEKSILIDLGLVGLFGGYTALSTKGVASMLSYTLWRAITFPVTYLLVAILISTAIMQIKYVNRALQRFDATQVIPVQFVMFTLSVILGSAILYRDFERTSGGDAGKFVGGCALTFAGVWLITSGRHQRRGEDEENLEPEDEQSISLMNGDVYHDEPEEITDSGRNVQSSRRSSTLRAASPPIIIDQKSPTHEVHLGPTPPTTTAGGPPSHLGTPPTTTRAPVSPVSPSPLGPNRQAQLPSSDSPSQPPPRRPRTPRALHSSPVLPTAAALSTSSIPNLPLSSPNLPLATPISPHLRPHPRPHTPNRGHSDSITAFPTTPDTAPPRLRRPDTAIGGLLGPGTSLPGPLLASPLSSTLSAVVEGLKRGGSLRIPGPSTAGAARRESLVFGEEIGEGAGNPARGRDGLRGEGVTRGRSLSGTLEELWRGVMGSSTDPGDADVREDREERGQQDRARAWRSED